LIGDRWDQKPEKRPTFRDVVERLVSGGPMLSEVEEAAYNEYVGFLHQ
jgi:hypothetical protein